MARFILAVFVSHAQSTATPIVAVDGEIGTSTQEVPVASGICILEIKKESQIWEATLAFRDQEQEKKLLVVQLTTEENFRLVFEQTFIQKNEFLVSCLRADFTPDSQAIADAWDLLHAPAQIQKILKKGRRG